MKLADRLEARKTKFSISFEQWCQFLDGAALTCGWRTRITRDTGTECWWEYYDAGYTPLEALVEDMSYA